MTGIDITELSTTVKPFRKDWGIFFTPSWVVDFMVNLIDEGRLIGKKSIKILEPACGLCQFLSGIQRNKTQLFGTASKTGVEINKEVVAYAYMNRLNTVVDIINTDFLLWNTEHRFDIIVGNPPYGIPAQSDHYSIKISDETKKQYRKIFETWYGKYNMYGAFTEKAIKLLKNGGQLIFIVPATFMILDEFKKLRKFLSHNGTTEIIYMGSDVFKPYADVSVVVLKFTKAEPHRLLLYDFEKGKLKLLNVNNHWNGEVVLFSTAFSKEIEAMCSFRVADVYDIKISPRTTEIKSNPYVVESQEKENLLPILSSRNLKIGEIVYEPSTLWWIEADKKTKLRKFFDKPHIVIGLGFRKNRQIAVAYDSRAYPWMGDVYHLIRKHNFDLSDKEVVNIMGSNTVQKYVNDTFRDITYHLSITQLKLLPLPAKGEVQRFEKMSEQG